MQTKSTALLKLKFSSLIDKKQRQKALKQARGIWNHKKKKIAQEYRTMRREWG